jgi:hypothetical protein
MFSCVAALALSNKCRKSLCKLVLFMLMWVCLMLFFEDRHGSVCGDGVCGSGGGGWGG